jgi:hypothetical protein
MDSLNVFDFNSKRFPPFENACCFILSKMDNIIIFCYIYIYIYTVVLNLR